MPPPPGMATGEEWQRLSARMLFVHPVRMAGGLIVPLLLAVFFGFGRSDGGFGTNLGFVGVAAVAVVAFGVLPWLTTYYRLTTSKIQVKRGLLNKTVLTAPLDRVRSVDLESSVLHRMLGLSKVSVGTGVDDTRIELDSLTVPQARELQDFLRRRSRVTSGDGDPAVEDSDAPTTATTYPDGVLRVEEDLARIDWSWLRYAPFSLSSLVIVAGIGGLAAQFVRDIPLDEVGVVQDVGDWLVAQSLPLLVAAVAVLVLVGWLLLSTLNYVVQWWNLRLTRMPEGTLRLSRGLFTTRSTTVEEAKIRGVVLREAFVLRWVRGAELSTLSTGVGNGGQTKVLPPCPRTVAIDVGHTVLEEEGSLTLQLQPHGYYAWRRLQLQGQISPVVFALVSIAPTLMFDLPWWIPVLVWLVLAGLAVLVSQEAYRNLGHGLTEGHVISGHGALMREREVLERGGIIGWVVRQTIFQRRLGLATLVATTAAGSESVTIDDVPYDVALAVAQEATPHIFADLPSC